MNRAVILLYHRVARAAIDPWQLCVSPEHFEQHLSHLRRSFRVISLPELVDAHVSGSIPANAVAVTFDDGYADNLLEAMPLLEDSSTPATFFVTSGAIGSTRGFWWDELARYLLGSECLPEILELDLGSHKFRLPTKDANSRRLYRWWSGRKEADKPESMRVQFHRRVYEHLRTLSPNDCRLALDQIAEWSRANGTSSSQDAMTIEQLIELASSDLVGIGAHSVNHPVLSNLSPQAQKVEIQESKRQLGEIIGRNIVGFAYPNGTCRDFNPQTTHMVQDSGFHYACAAEDAVVLSTSNRFALPRITVGDWDGETFEHHLRRWLCD